MVFPYDFGFVPSTRAEDGDPIDVLLLMDEQAFPGCVVESRLIGVIEAEQQEDGRTTRNDRLVAVAKESHSHSNLRELRDLNRKLLRELGEFFANYQQLSGARFKVLGYKGPREAMALLAKAIKKAA
jgi:inorganic pyrophosphatase